MHILLLKKMINQVWLFASISKSKAHITHCHKNYIWFSCWIMGWKTRMRYILKQNKSILNLLFLVMISSFRRDIKIVIQEEVWKNKKCCMGLLYTVVCFCDSLRRSEGLHIDRHMLNRYISVGYVQSGTPHHDVSLHIVIIVCDRFKGERGEMCHSLPLAETNNLGFKIWQVVKLLISVQGGTNSPQVPWDFLENKVKIFH